MRYMSFAMTTEQFRNRTKTVTRRFGWWFLKPGDVFMGVEKIQGLKKGEKIQKIHPARVVSVRAEPLISIKKEDLIKEGFPGIEPLGFVLMMMDKYKCNADAIVNRIEFEHCLAGDWICIERPFLKRIRELKKMLPGYRDFSDQEVIEHCITRVFTDEKIRKEEGV